MTPGANLEGAVGLHDYGGDGPEYRIRPSARERARAALLAARALALLSLPVGLVMALLTRSLVWVVVVELWAVLAGVLSYFGQAHNAVFVGEEGVRRISRGCSVIAPWAALKAVEVSVPGNRLVVFRIDASELLIKKLSRGRSRAAIAMAKNLPEGLELRLDRASADSLVGLIAGRRPELDGLERWATSSRPGPLMVSPAPPGDREAPPE
ncbi:MAG: hypothetical protein ACYDC5_06375 [Candidatus Dormibacteria bacterium]